jgi:hypothetical protein
VTKRTPTDDTTPADNKTLRCPAVEGAQQCLAARHGKMQNHRWGPKGETDQWHADGRPKDWFAPDPADTLVTGNADVLAAASPPDGGQAADPTPSVVPSAGGTPEPSRESTASPAGSGGGGSGRPSPDETDMTLGELKEAWQRGTPVELVRDRHAPTTRSIGRVIANTAIDAALGVPVNVQDERAHGREATEILVEAAADHWRHNRHMPAARLLDLQAVVDHMVTARGLQ